MESPDEHLSRLVECTPETRKLREELARRTAAEAASRLVANKYKSERDAFMSAFDECPFPQILCAPDGRALRINKAAKVAMGGMEAPPDFTVFNDPQLILLNVPEHFSRALAGEKVRMPRYVFNVGKTHMGAPDLDLTLETVLHPVFGAGGKVESVVVQHFDLTPLAAAEAEIERLRALLRNAGIGY
ncbi:MAG: hypothetical protein ACOZEN_08075 [Thermodesulfobacteriota bacterium]